MSITANESYSVVVSLTSWRGRIYSEIVQLVLFSLLKQKTMYRYKVVLVLSTDEFPKKEAELPANIVKMAEKVENFEIRWCKKNSRALKKIYSMDYYPDLPVITTDDDIIVKDDFVEQFMNAHTRYPKDIVYAKINSFPGDPLLKIGCMARLFPPHSLYTLPQTLFDTILMSAEDDLWNGLRAKLAGTPIRSLGCWPFVGQIPIGNTAFWNIYHKIDRVAKYKELCAAISRGEHG